MCELSRVGVAFALLAGVLLTNPARASTIAVTTTVAFFVQARVGVARGAEVWNQATIVFDANPPIPTEPWCDRIDTTLPASRVELVARACSGAIALRWSGTDEGAGVASYDVLVSENGGSAPLWLHDTVEVSGVFAGVPGNTYAFFSRARDHIGNTEPAPAAPDAVVPPRNGCCRRDADCDDDDPCTAERCAGTRCEQMELSGLAGARCLCERPAPTACAGETLPRRLTKKTAQEGGAGLARGRGHPRRAGDRQGAVAGLPGGARRGLRGRSRPRRPRCRPLAVTARARAIARRGRLQGRERGDGARP